MKNFKLNFATWFGIFIVLFLGTSFLRESFFTQDELLLPYSQLIEKIKNNEINSITISNRNITGIDKSGVSYISYGPSDDVFLMELNKYSNTGIEVNVEPRQTKLGYIIAIIISSLPTLLFLGIWFFLARQFSKGMGGSLGLKSKINMAPEVGKKHTFDDIAGSHNAKQEVGEVIDFLRDPTKYQDIGGKIPKGCLLVGPPGTGKTLLARAIAGEANVPFFYTSGSDFVEIYVGMGASRVRDLFIEAKKHSPCIIFIDEMDAVGGKRNKTGGMGGNDEREQTLNQMLVEMDGFVVNQGVIVIAATNRPDVLDGALLRPGRFDRQIKIPLPNLKERNEILDLHLSKVKYDKDTILSNKIAQQTTGLSGAELANLINEAALIAARNNRKKISISDIENAQDKVFMGSEQKSLTMLPREKELTAYHEGGHALIAACSDAAHPIHKATIIPRGKALGAVIQVPEHDRVSQTYEELQSMLTVMMGGRVAEALIYGNKKITSGAASDIQQATNIAQHMVMQWGMSKDLGPVLYNSHSPYTEGVPSSPQTVHIIDKEVKEICNLAYKRAEKILKDNIDVLHLLAKELINRETLTGEEINELIKGKISQINIATLSVE